MPGRGTGTRFDALVTVGVGTQNSPRYAPAGLLVAHRGVRVMIDGGSPPPVPAVWSHDPLTSSSDGGNVHAESEGIERRDAMSLFLSYARQDKESAEAIGEAFEHIGRPTWIDRRLTGGQDWWDIILGQIREADAFVLCLSPDSAKSKACRLELGYAMATKRPLMPVMVRTVDPRLFPEAIASFQYVDYREPTIATTLDLVTALNNLPPAGAAPDPLPEPPPVPISYLDEFQDALGAEAMTFREQAALLASLRARGGDEDDREAVLELLKALRRRPDITEAVARDIDQLIPSLAQPAEEPEPVLAGGPKAEQEHEHDHEHDHQFAQATRVEQTPKSGTKLHRLVAPGVDTHLIANRVHNWLLSEKLEAQMIEEDGQIIVQCRSAQKWKNKLGAGVAFTIRLWTEEPDLLVEFGQAKWVDKAVAGAIGLLIAWPAIIPAAWGAALQKSLPEKALRLIEQSIPEATRHV